MCYNCAVKACGSSGEFEQALGVMDVSFFLPCIHLERLDYLVYEEADRALFSVVYGLGSLHQIGVGY